MLKRLAFALALLLAPAAALASNCSSYTYNLVNGQIADANQVMSNFNNILNCANNNLVNAATVGATYAPLASPNFTGVPSAPTAAPGTSTTQIGTTAFTTAAIVAQAATDAGNYAPLASPALTGVPTAPTAAAATNTTQIATTAFATTAVINAAPPAASTTTPGIVPLATGAQTLTGTDTTHAVTPASLASSQTLAATGYDKLPGGLILEWGTSGSIPSGNGSGVVQTFAQACASTVYSVVATPNQNPGTGGMAYYFVSGVGTTGFTLTNQAGVSLTYYWQAICK